MMNDILKSIQIAETDLETKEHGHKPVIQLRGGLRLAAELMVSKSESEQQRAAIMEQARKEVVDRIWRMMYGDIALAWGKLRNEIARNLDPLRMDQLLPSKLDEFAKLFRRP